MTKKHTLFVAVLTIATTSIANNLQIAFVDSFKAMRECSDGKVVGEELNKMRDKLSNEIQQEAQKIAKEENDLKAKVSMLKPEVLAKEQRRLDKLKRDLEEAVREKEEMMKVTMQQKTEDLAIKVEEGIIAAAKAQGVDAVIDKMSGRVMYTKDENTGDITNATIAFVDKKSEIDKKSVAVAAKKDDKPKAAAAAA